ncbi:MAG TPA: hypothetical protein VL882_18030 [Vicinamibacterales bacterium]|jgi:hypothetical protein|nr:hypothetical protein [Vicinamibacterales bacterium]
MTTVDVEIRPPQLPPPAEQTRALPAWIELAKILALPLVTLVLGYWFNSTLNERQQTESNIRLYAEMMGRREEADSNLRKDMFNSILATFMARDPTLRLSSEETIRRQILSLELLAYNFHESLDIAPLFKDVERRIVLEERAANAELRGRLESVALQVIEHQLTALSDVGLVERGDALPQKISDFQAHIQFGTHTIPDPQIKPGEGTSRLCLSMEAVDGSRHYRQFKLELIGLKEAGREVQVHLYVSQLLTADECRQPNLDLQGKREVDTNFIVGLFDFPLIDNTRLSGGERASVSLTALNPNVLSVALAYFPSSRASLKDKPYYDEVMRDLRRNRQPSTR